MENNDLLTLNSVKIDYLNDEKIMKILSLSESYNKIKDNISKYNIIIFSHEYFLDSIMKTYRDNGEIIKQFLLDFDREYVVINNKIIRSLDDFFLLVSEYNKKIELNNKNITILTLIMLLACQTSFYLSFKYLFDKIEDLKNNNIYSESIHLTDRRKKNMIRFIISENIFKCEIVGFYQVLDISSLEVLHKITTRTLYDNTINNCLLVIET